MRNVMFCGAAICVAALAQAPQKLAFEVASVKPGSADEPMIYRLQPGGRYIATAQTLRFLVANAYRVPLFSITGGPAWRDSEKYDIEAKSAISLKPWPDSTAQISEMLQSLLEERFRFAFHRETREETVYELVIAKSGSKLTAAKEGESPGFSTDPGRMRSMAVPLTVFAATLSDALGHQVIDKTSLEGKFTFTLTWTPDSAAAGEGGPSIFTAIEQQLGLKLHAVKGPVDVLVIDRAERPDPN